ncbi:CBP80/20-dependent translation initiation factor [Salmo salar]|uniref:CBP80/20-dependent translation initiation factor n=1 Tax=Salmo salar TaxID=8030 RepID=A0ABM3CQA4_SALSA|nr:CBP80/20-dependent translation initiation factor [Salmo salar]
MENSSVASASSEAGSTRSQEIEELERFIDSYVLEYQVQGLLGDKNEADLDGDNKPKSHISQWTEDCNDRKDGSWSSSRGRGSTKPDEWDHSSNGSTGSRPSSGSRPGSGSRSGSRGRNNQFRGPAKVQNGNREGSFDILGTDIWAANTMDSHGGATWDLQPEKLDFSQFHRKPFRGTPKHLPHIDREGMMKGKFEDDDDDGIDLNDMEKFLPGLTGFPPLPNEAEIAHTKKLFRRRRNDRRRQQQQRPPGGGGDRKTQNPQQQSPQRQQPPSQQQPVNQQQNDQQQPGPGGHGRYPRDQQQGGQRGGSHGQQFQCHGGQRQGPPHHGYSQNRRWHHNQKGQGVGQGLQGQGGPAGDRDRDRGATPMGDRDRGGTPTGDRDRGGHKTGTEGDTKGDRRGNNGDRDRGGTPTGDRDRGGTPTGDRDRGGTPTGDRDRGGTPTGDRDRGVAPLRNTKETENVKAEEASTRLETESSRGPSEGLPSQPGGQEKGQSPTGSDKHRDSQLDEGPKVSLLQSSKERLRRRLKDKEEAVVSPVGPQWSRMDRLLEILNSMRNNSAGVDSQLSSFMEEAQNSAQSEETLDQIVSTIYDKALSDRSFAATAARLCDKMALFMVEGTKFRSLLLNMLQKDFCRRVELQASDVELWLGFITFLCEVFGTMRSSAGEPFRVLVCPIYTCLRELLQSPEVKEDAVLCCSMELQSTGHLLEEQLPEMMTELLATARDKMLCPAESQLTRSLLMEVIELRAHHWSPLEALTTQYYNRTIQKLTTA